MWFFIIFILMLILGFPIYFSMIASSLFYIVMNPNLSLMIAIQKMINAPNSFTLLAVPFFILAGQVMNTGGVTKRIFDFALKLVGHFRGGLGYVNILASLIFSGMSGSALADVGGLGMIEIKAMRDAGYDDDFTIGVTGASGTIGPIIPPSIPFVIFGSVANVSIGAMFVGGIIPGLLTALALCVMVYFIAKKRDYKIEKRANIGELWASFKEAFFALLTPVIILGGIWTGYFTPTEAAFVSIVYAILVTVFIYKDTKPQEIPQMICETVKTLGPSIVIVVAAAIFAWVITYEQIDKAVVDFLLSITTNKYVILIIMNIVFLIMGMFLEIVAAIMIVLPIFQPLIQVVGIHPVHFGMIMVLNLMIGLLTPPVGFSLNILSSITKHSFEETTRMMLPWLIPLFIALLLVTYVPSTVLFLPKLLGFI